MKAVWKNVVLAESDDTIVVEGNHYFPPESWDGRFFEANAKITVCPWKGTAHYYDVVVDDERNAAAAWHYPETKDAADNIKGYVAFWRGVDVSE